jgi:hypothetical protein
MDTIDLGDKEFKVRTDAHTEGLSSMRPGNTNLRSVFSYETIGNQDFPPLPLIKIVVNYNLFA